MKTKLPSIATFVFLTITFFSDASLAGGPHINASEVNWRSTYTDYGPEFAKAFRFKTLIGDEYAPVQGKNVYFGEAEWAPGAIYVGHKHPSPEIYYVISGEAEWTVDGKAFKATPGTTIYARPYAVHRIVNVGNQILKTVWMWWGEPWVLNQYPELVEPFEEQPKGARFTD